MSHNRRMSAEPEVAPKASLRERKKARTRAAIRTEAFRLFDEQGYNETTIEQIADAADVSPSTFFRYFPTKEQLVLADDLDAPMIEAFEAQPKNLPILKAFRLATEAVFGELPTADLEFEKVRQELLYSVPELKRAVMQEMVRSIDMIAELIAQRIGRSEDDFEVRALAGAMIGAVLGVIDKRPGDLMKAMQAIRYVEDGLPLGHVQP